MILECDIGNTRCKWRLVGPNGILRRGAFECANGFGSLDLSGEISRVRVSSVAADTVNEQLVQHLVGNGLIPEFASSTRFAAGVKNSYKDAGRLGVDRWVAMVAAHNRCRRAVLVLDAGSALTADLISQDGEHVGGYILPGIRLMKASLLAETGRVRFGNTGEDCSIAFGVDTGSAVSAGVIAAQVGAALVALEQSGRQIATDFAILITGGDAGVIAENLPDRYLADVAVVPELVLDGLQWVLP